MFRSWAEWPTRRHAAKKRPVPEQLGVTRWWDASQITTFADAGKTRVRTLLQRASNGPALTCLATDTNNRTEVETYNGAQAISVSYSAANSGFFGPVDTGLAGSNGSSSYSWFIIGGLSIWTSHILFLASGVVPSPFFLDPAGGVRWFQANVGQTRTLTPALDQPATKFSLLITADAVAGTRTIWAQQLAPQSLAYTPAAALAAPYISNTWSTNAATPAYRSFFNEQGYFPKALALAERGALAAYVNKRYPTLPPVTWA